MPGGFGVAADNLVGVGVEHTPGHPAQPMKWLPVTSESLTSDESIAMLRYLKGYADPTGAKLGNETHEGSLEVDALHDCIPWLLAASRTKINKSTTADPFTYVAAPTSEATKGDFGTLTLWIRRNGVWFVYTGCTVSRFSFSINDGLLSSTWDIIALNEMDGPTARTQSGTTAAQTPDEGTVSFADTAPWGAGEYAVSVGNPTRTQVFDVDTFSFEIDDGGEAQHRLQNSRRGPWFVKFGERSVKASTTRDFTSRADYDNFKKLTRTGFSAKMSYQEDVGTPGSPDLKDRSLELVCAAAIVDSFTVDSSGGQGAIVTGNVDYMAIAPGTAVYGLTVETSEDIRVDNASEDPNLLGQAAEDAPGWHGTTPFTRAGIITWLPEGGDVTGYVVRYRPVGGSDYDWKVVEVSGANTVTTTPDGIDSGPLYEAQVASRVGVYVGEWSAVQEQSTT